MARKTLINTVDAVRILFFGLILAGMYYATLQWLIEKDWVREDYNYAYLIPVLVLYLIWEKRRELSETPSRPSWIGGLPFALGVVSYWLGELAGEFYAQYMSLWLIIVGLVWMYMGWEKIKQIAFALCMILAMFPLPVFLYNKVSFQLKLISSQLGVAMIQMYGMSAFREGNVIDLGFTQLQVVDACSGLRFLIPLIILGFLLAYFFKDHWWKRAVVVLTTIPLSVVTNSLRIALTGILYEAVGPETAEGFFHGFSGWFIFMFTLAVLLFEMWVLGKLPPRKARHTTASADPPAGDGVSGISKAGDTEGVRPTGSAGLFRPPQALVGAILLLLTLALSQGVEFREKIPPSKSFAGFPLQVGSWTGERQTMEERFLTELDLSDYVMANYRNPAGRMVDFYVAYYQSQRKGESIHSPETCLPGGGWLFKEAGSQKVPTPGFYGGSMLVNRALMEKGESVQLSYFWFPARGRILQDAYQMKFYTFWDSLTKQRTDGALVRLITPLYPGEKLSDAEERLQAFVKDMTPMLAEYLPGEKLASAGGTGQGN